MKTIWLLVLVILLAGVLPVCAADEAEKDIPLYDGKPGTKIGDVCINPKDGAEMVWVPAGEFLMGSTDEDIATLLKEHPVWKEEIADEMPQHKIQLSGYWVYKYEVTVAQYRKFCEATSRKMAEGPKGGWKDDNHPVVTVNWDDASAYAKWAEASLPTEAQWEKAARGTDGRVYPWGNEWDASKCANSVDKVLNGTQPVGSYPAGASPYGCMDVAGNVSEWCEDRYDGSYYSQTPKGGWVDPQGPRKGAYRILRGGNIASALFIKSPDRIILRFGNDQFLTCAYRCAHRSCFSEDPKPFALFGFRCARTP